MTDVEGTIATFTVDRIAYSPSPPIVFAVVDFDGGGRLPVELTDVDADELQIGDRVEMTFRRLFTADGIHNYFWKARPVRGSRPRGSGGAMGSHGIKDQVAIVGMGCTPLRRALGQGRRRPAHRRVASEAFASAGVDKDDVDAYWLGTAMSGMTGMALARPLQLAGQAGDAGSRTSAPPAPRRCATPRTRWRSGAYDIAMAIGVEKVKDSGYQGLVGAAEDADRRHRAARSPRRRCSRCAPRRTPRSTASTTSEMREVLARISWKNHYNGARNPRAQFRSEVSTETICSVAAHGRRPRRASTARASPTAPRRRSSCRAEDAHKYTDKPLYIKALSFVAGNCSGNADPDYDYTTFPEIEAAAADAYAQAGVTDPRHEIAMAEVHDCFTPAELLIMEDLGFAERGTAWKEVLAGTFDLDGELPVNPDGGLKSFGHPVGASGLRMMFEAWLQLRGEAPEERQIEPPTATSASPTTSAATPARWCRSSAWSAPSSADAPRRPARMRDGAAG